ncbi:hypothetical protein [Salmonella phage NINP13076]|nr:hypothetical protein [Salmonella phage NINP13076]
MRSGLCSLSFRWRRSFTSPYARRSRLLVIFSILRIF